MSKSLQKTVASVVVIAMGTAVPAWAGSTMERVSVGTGGVQGNSDSRQAMISAGGRFVVFDSEASNLVPGDTNGVEDVFIRDRWRGTTERVSVSSVGIQGNAESHFPSLSAEGRFVAFFSGASNLVPGDTNGATDVFVRDRLKGTTERISVSSTGVQGNLSSFYAAISANGRFVVFGSDANNLVPGDTNDSTDVFVHDRWVRTTLRVSISSNGTQGNGYSGVEPVAISPDGRFVAFSSVASNLVPGDTNASGDVFLRDRLRDTTERVSVSSAGIQGNGGSSGPSLSSGGRLVVFASEASNLVPGDANGTIDVFLHDRLKGTTKRVSIGVDGEQANGASERPMISANGRFVAFASGASNLVPGDTNGFEDTFVRDQWWGMTERVSVARNNSQGNNSSFSAAISPGGRFTTFGSVANNLVPGDTNGVADMFIRDRGLLP